ncbi:gp25 domain protein [Mycobacterium xenopi 3993]|nr:gp25 domain protein [Mycobacterium xenopi 3993]
MHTQEGDGNADSLARYLADPASQVSYHYTISTGYPHDDGVTVCDVVDTDLASWSVGDANNGQSTCVSPGPA